MAPSHTDLEFIINHVILPRQLPPSQEQDRHALEDALLQFLRSTAEQYCTVCPAESLVHWKRILGTLTQWSAYLRHGLFSSSVLSSQIDAMQPSDLLALDFSGHNAALIIRRVEEGFVFEDFEPLADNKSVMACKGSLIRRFPSRSIIVSKTIMCDVDFRHELVNLICRLQEETFLSAQATVKKAGVKLHEPRELPSSELVSQLLMSIVAASGKAYETVQIKMRTRDTVEWRNAYLPWRRSSLWQVIKVTIRLSLALALGAEAGFNQYKSFMLVLNQSICRQAVETNQSPSTLHMIRAKMARRAAKMTESLLPNVKEMVHQTGMEACRNIEARWRVIQATNTAASAIEALPSFEDRDTYLFLRSSGTFLRQTIEVPLHALSECSFEPDERSRLTHGRAGLPTLPAQDRDHDHLLLVLLDFEEWIACKLDGWVASTKADQSLGRELCDLANRYLDLAGHSYLPSQFSPLLLTVLHVWKAADEMIVKLHPTLASHAPGIPASFLEPLVLPTLQQLEAVTGIESYLIRRRGAALNPCCTVFSQPDPTSVAIQIYDSSSRYRKEREKIEKHAQTEQELKEKAWIAGKAEYDRLREKANSMNCDEVKDSDDELVHSYRCRKCKIIEQADGMTIQVFEWPLPAEESMLKAVIFELLCPAEIKLWRDLTWRLLHDLGRKVKASSSATPFEYVRDYRGLVSHATGSEPRITLRSTTKSNYVTHYKDPKIHSAWSKVNLPHGLKYRMFDRQGATWLADQLAEPNVRYKTNTRLPDGPYKNIEATVNDTSHTSNWVVANQDKCSDLLSLDAFYAFGSLRAGESIQWLNILRVLASRELDLNDQAILILIQQTIWQMGTPHPSSGYRTSHARLDDPAFITSLLRLVEDCLARICENWKEEHSMDLMICLLLRVSELATDKKAIQEAIRLLNVARNTCFGWVKQLLEAKGHDADSEQSKSDEEMRFRVVRICLLCLGTFDLPAEHVQTAFARDSNGQSHSNTKFYVAAAIIVHDHRPRGDLHTLSPHWQRLLVRNNRVTHKAERYLRQAILQDRQGVDAAIQLMWEGFDSEESWECYQEPNARWVRARTIAPSSEKTQLVQYNLLSGKLLVDSHPLGRLPAEYRADSLFQRLLGNASPMVLPSDMAGMRYMTSYYIQSNRIYFDRSADSSLVIRVRSGTECYQIIPTTQFGDDFPRRFLKDFIHWLNLESRTVEFRPLTSRWVRSDTNPILRLSTGGDGSILHLPHARLIESKRALGKAIIRILQPIEQSAHVCISETIVNDKREIQVELPRYGLHFFCNERGQLESRDLAAVVASSQSIGSLIGLRSRLVIEGLGVFSSSHTRSILIPRGTVSVEKGEEHVTVSIRPTANRQGQLSYFRWSVDNHVGIIRTGSRLGEILYLAQLNALTSYCDPDPLTDRTGTESAIELLAEAKNKLWKPLELDEATRLREIALLAPVMAWYPTNLRRMQQVTWASVPSPLAQHDGLLTASAQIFGRSTSLQLFSHSNHSVPGPPQFDKHLLERSQVRSAAFYRHGFGSELQSRPHDASYKAESTVWNQKSAASCSLFRHAVETPISFDFEGELVSRFQALSIGGYGRSVVRGTLSELLAIDILNEWGALYESCRLTDWAKNRYKISVLLATIAYGQNSGQQDLLRTLLMISKSTGPWPICDPADVINFDLRKGWAIGSNELRRIIRGHWNYEKHSKNVRKKHPHLRDAEDRQRDVASQETTQLIDHIETQWPCDSLDAAEGLSSSYFNKSQAIAACIGKITTWNHNRLYIGHLRKLETMLAPLRGVTEEQNMLKPSIRSDARLSDLSWRALGIAKLIMQIRAQEDHIGPSPSSEAGVTGVSGASGNEQTDENFSDTTPSTAKTPETSRAAQTVSLNRILQPFSRSSDEIRRFYGQDLEDSLKAYRSCSGASIKGDVNHGSIGECRIRTAFENLQQRDQQVSELKAELTRLWAAENEQYDLLRLGGLEPRGAPSATLATLAQKNIPSEGTWKDHSYRLGRSIQAAQQARRLLINLERNDLSSYRDELNVIKWNVDDMYTKYPEWLLLEIQNDFLIRPLQVRVAEWMLQLPPEDNALVQLNMGEGKSSVILPMVVLVSPHYKRAAHIIVLKPLHAQMLATLGRKLTGMVGRELLSTPLDRKTNLNAYSADLARLWRECAENKGVLVMLPENQLSFHIRCIQQPSLLKLKEGLDRDFAVFVDESDAILAENALLVYTEGTQRSLDGSPNRWTTTQTLLKILIQQLSSKYPDVRDITGDGTLYQLGLKLRALPTNALPDLIDQIPSLIMKDGVDDSLSIPYADPALRAAAARFIRHDHLDPEGIESLQVLTEETCWTNLLILRGLIAHGILLKQLMDKRWNVDFGLDRSRTLLAVPYRAKGVPSMSSEYQHPDVTVILTCLAWYHTGLSEIEMIECFKELMKSGDPSEKYKEWTDLRADMPEGLRNLENVNTEDKRQLQDWLVPVFAFNKAAIDFFLSFAVFPKKAKEFPHKLSASAWDISGAGVPHSMTGFSGTNDSRQLLPTSIRQHDLEGLRHTNAMMLERLLLPENQRYYIAIENGVRLDTVELLKKIISSGPVTRVIIDVGAQVMDLDNRSLASKWLELDGSADAVAFFDADDTLLVLSRDSRVEHFAASAQSSRPDNCNFYLDEVHTRGIDIKFIDGTHAAVTLGPRLTKDRLVQACMRLRKLGRTHSVSFYAPPEIDARIRACGGKLASDDITSADVCGWVMEETCQALHRKRPVWIEQGMRHRRGKLELDNLLASVNGELEALTDDTEEVESYKQAMLEEDAKTLEEMYGPRARSEDHPPVPLSASMRQDPAVATLVLQWKALSKNDRMAQNTTQEQDRELEQELEQERQIQRPASMKPRAHSVEQLARLIDTGSLPQQIGPGSGMLYAFDLLRKTSVRALLPAQPISTELLCTRDFSLTVECARDDDLDEYLRPVHFVLSHGTAQRTVLLIVSPFEVGALLENILRSAHVTLHVFSARATRAMPSLLGLSLYTLGKPWSAAAAAPSASFEVLRRELALFSGELYFPSLEHYEALCRFLGVVDGIHVGGAEGEVFERSPFRMLKGWVAMRRQGGEFERTHVGWLVAARRLLPDAFD